MNENESGTNPQITSDDFNPMDLIIDAEFKNSIPALAPQEYLGLEAMILIDGCINPLIVWKGKNILVDGHNRLDICTKHKIKFRIKEKEFEDRESVITWIKKNQLSRRNMTKSGQTYIIGKTYESKKQNVGGDRGNQYRTTTVDMVDIFELDEQSNNISKPNVHSEEMPQVAKIGSTAEKIAETFNVGKSTVLRAEQFSKAVDNIYENFGGDIKTKILSEELGMTFKEIIILAEADIETQKKRIARARADPDKTKVKKPEKPQKSPEQINAEMLGVLRNQITQLSDEELDYICQEIAEIRAKRSINSAYEPAVQSASAPVIASNEVETKHEPEEQL